MSIASKWSSFASGIRPPGRTASGSSRNFAKLATEYFSETGPSGTESALGVSAE